MLRTLRLVSLRKGMKLTVQIESIYTDGACQGNPGPGGWGVVACLSDGNTHEMGGYEALTTNNRMELQGAIAALEFLISSDQSETITLYTDSEYVKNGITLWIQGWKQKGWKTAQGKPVLNKDLWQRLDALKTELDNQLKVPLQWQYVRGHSGNPGNERCDQIAQGFARGNPPPLSQVKLQPSSSEGQSEKFRSERTDTEGYITIQSLSEDFNHQPISFTPMETTAPSSTEFNLVSSAEALENLPREARVIQLRHLVETLHMADEIAERRYLISSSELADLMDVNASAVTSRGDNWVWRNWVVSRVRREGNQILWQLERVD